MTQRFPIAKVIAVDIDGTLVQDGRLHLPLLDWIRERKQEQFRLMLWSARGREYVMTTAHRFGVVPLFDDLISKPGLIVDDQGWTWTQYTRRVVLPSA